MQKVSLKELAIFGSSDKGEWYDRIYISNDLYADESVRKTYITSKVRRWDELNGCETRSVRYHEMSTEKYLGTLSLHPQ